MQNPSSVIAKDKHAGHVKFNLTESDTGISGASTAKMFPLNAARVSRTPWGFIKTLRYCY